VNHFEYGPEGLACEGVPLARIAADVGTPVYVYSRATLERHFTVFRDALELSGVADPLIAYAVKANSNVAVLKVLGDLGAGADTVSEGEVRRALAAGIPAERIVFSGVGKTRREVEFALKAGVAEIMDAVQVLLANPQIRHGTIKILFTPDEEIGRGADKVDLKKLGAAFGYTIDGESVGHLEDETFSADGVTITIQGVSAHPGFAKGKMEHALKIASRIVDRLPQDMAPEATEGREGFLHPVGLQGGLDSATLSLIVRDFTEQGLKEKEGLLEDLVRAVMKDFPRSSYTLEVKQQYRNMKEVLDRHPEVVEYALEAIGRAGLQPVLSSIRGGTDGSRLSFMGLPCPNIFAGEHAFHSRLEWVSVQDMEAAVRTIVHLAAIWEERA